MLVALALLLQANDKAQANAYDDAWETGWVAHCRTVYTTTDKTAGFVLQVGDSITHSNPYSQWPKSGAGQTLEDQAITAWTMAAAWGIGNAVVASKNGWYLAAADTVASPPDYRGMTAASGIDTAEFLSGNGNGGPAMPGTGVTATAQGYVVNTTYTGNLHIQTVASAFADAQFAVVMLGTNDCSAGRAANLFIADLTSIVDALEARNIVVVLSTIPPHWAQTALAVQYNAQIALLAQTRGLPLIDFHSEVLARQPANWNGTLLGFNDVHPTASSASYNSSSNPYQAGGSAATHATGAPCAEVGYLLRSWLTVQKLKEVKDYVADGNDPPGGGPGPGPGPAPAPSSSDDDDSSCGCGTVGAGRPWGALGALLAAALAGMGCRRTGRMAG